MNPVINEPQYSGHIDSVAALKGFFNQEINWLSFCLGQNKVAILINKLAERSVGVPLH